MSLQGLDSSLKIVGDAWRVLALRLDYTGHGARRIFWRAVVAAAESSRRTAERTSSALVASLETLERQARTRSRQSLSTNDSSALASDVTNAERRAA
jgi:hypothetical protein